MISAPSAQVTSGSRALDSLLAGFACGALGPAMHALVGGHLEMSPRNRRFVTLVEQALADDVERETCCAIRARETRLEAIFSCCENVRRSIDMPCSAPKAVRHFIGRPIDTLPFRASAPGIDEYRLAEPGGEAAIYRIGAGRSLTLTAAGSFTALLVLCGGVTGDAGRYGPGDILVLEAAAGAASFSARDGESLCFAAAGATPRHQAHASGPGPGSTGLAGGETRQS